MLAPHAILRYVSTDDSTAISPRDEEEGLGGRFWLKLVGVIALVGVLVFVGVLLFWRALYAWGFFGAFLVLALALLLYGWIHDRRNPHPNLD
jgi:polyferredoxin